MTCLIHVMYSFVLFLILFLGREWSGVQYNVLLQEKFVSGDLLSQCSYWYVLKFNQLFKLEEKERFCRVIYFIGSTMQL